jgi:hypothetical protein
MLKIKKYWVLHYITVIIKKKKDDIFMHSIIYYIQ